jgi:hypothetical protein
LAGEIPCSFAKIRCCFKKFPVPLRREFFRKPLNSLNPAAPLFIKCARGREIGRRPAANPQEQTKKLIEGDPGSAIFLQCESPLVAPRLQMVIL